MSETTVENAALDDENQIQKNLKTFESRWRYAVFPAMVLFVLLIGFMFYLIYGMLQRMQDLSEDIDKMTTVMSESLPVMQGAVVAMASRMQWVGDDLKDMSGNVNEMTQVIGRSMPNMEHSMNGMSSDMSNMAYATNNMSATTHNMGQNLWDLNRNVSAPMSMFNKMNPFKGKTAPAPRMPQYQVARSSQQYYYPAQTTQNYAAPVTQGPAVVANQAAPVAAAVPMVAMASPNLNVQQQAGKDKFANYCASCHGREGAGGVGPSLLAHSASQVTKTLELYRDGTVVGTMTGVAKEMTDTDIENISSFIAMGSF